MSIKKINTKCSRRLCSLLFSLLLFVPIAHAQQAEVTMQLNEQFFDALLDSIFKSSTPLEFPLAGNDSGFKIRDSEIKIENSNSFVSGFVETKSETKNSVCSETIRLQREIDGVRTAVRFRDGKIFAPIAFSGNYNPPLIGCVGFSGWAETNIELEYDAERQTLFGRAKVLNVSLSGTGGVGGSLVTRLVQSAIDKRINPIQILQMDKVSFVVPMQNSGSLRMKAIGIRPEIANGALNVRIVYEFLKS